MYGTNFADIVKDWSDQDFSTGILPTSVAGVQVLVNGSPAPVWYVFPGQVNFQAPTDITGTATVTVVRNGVASAPATVNVVANSPGVIAYSADYKTYYPSAQFAGTTNIVGDPAVFGNTVKKALPGNQIQMYATGLASTQSGIVIGTPIPFPSRGDGEHRHYRRDGVVRRPDRRRLLSDQFHGTGGSGRGKLSVHHHSQRRDFAERRRAGGRAVATHCLPSC